MTPWCACDVYAFFQRGGDHDVHMSVDHVQAKKDAQVCSTDTSIPPPRR